MNDVGREPCEFGVLGGITQMFRPDRCCPHPLREATGAADAPRALAWCCRCRNVLVVPAGVDFEERTHGVLGGIPRVFMPVAWRKWMERRAERPVDNPAK